MGRRMHVTFIFFRLSVMTSIFERGGNHTEVNTPSPGLSPDPLDSQPPQVRLCWERLALEGCGVFFSVVVSMKNEYHTW